MTTLSEPSTTYRWKRPRLGKLAAELKAVSADRFRKISTIGGSQEVEFEKSLASLGFTYISDKAPRLLDHLVGFQLIERDNSDTKAVGIFGFRVNDSWLYAPIFFLNGDLKGHELLYLKDADMFVPMSENWINYIISQQPLETGEGVEGSLQSLGASVPNLMRLARPPLYGKFGSADLPEVPVYPSVPTQGWLSPSHGMRELLAGLTLDGLDKSASYVLAKHLDFSPSSLLEEILKSSPEMCKVAMDICDRYPVLGDYLQQFYGPDVFLRALQPHMNPPSNVLQKAASENRLLPYQPPQLVITTQIHAGLSDEDATKLAREGYLVDDRRDRDKLSAAFVQTPQHLQNPTETGVYDLLLKSGEFTRCVIFLSPLGSRSQCSEALVWSTEDSYEPTVFHTSRLFVRQNPDAKKDFSSWFDRQAADTAIEHKRCVFCDANGTATIPVRVRADRDGVYEAYASICCESSSRGGSDVKYEKGPTPLPHYSNSISILRKDDRYKCLTVRNRELFVPANVKVLNCSYESRHKELLPGDLRDAEAAVRQKTASLSVRSDGRDIIVNYGPRRSKSAAARELMEVHGLPHEDVEGIFASSHEAGKLQKAAKFSIAYAEGFPKQAFPGNILDASGISAPAIPEPLYGNSSLPTGALEQHPLQEFFRVDGIGPSVNDRNIYNPLPENLPDPMMTQLAQQAGQMGQKEVFATNMFTNMLRSVRQGSHIKKWSRDLMKALDRLGRILFLFYWHNQEFADRYGQTDLPELEDATRNSFESLGDLVLFLKERDVEPLGKLQLGEVDVADVAA